MDGSSAKKSTSLETLVIQNITNLNELKAKLSDIIKAGKDYDYDVSSCLKTLLLNSDQEIVLLTIQAVSELAKSDEKRETYANTDIVQPIVKILEKELKSAQFEIVKQCCRALGNLFCDCDTSRSILKECGGVRDLKTVVEYTLTRNEETLEAIKMLACKTLLNFAIGGQEFSKSLVQENLVELLNKILELELEKDDMCDDMVSTVLLILSVINDNDPEHLFEDKVNKAVLKVLRETTNVEISELCLEHLHAQAEHDSVKLLIANEGGLQLVCSRLEQLMQKKDNGDLNADDTEVHSIIKKACDLIIIVLTGDEAMQILYHNGIGEVYMTMVKWLDSVDYDLLATGVLAIGNFARQDDYCIQMMENKIFDKLLDLFEMYHGFALRMQKEPEGPHAVEAGVVTKMQHAVEAGVVTKMQHAVLSAVRNLAVPAANKRAAAAGGRAATLLLAALPAVDDPQVAYKLLAAVRMLVDGQEGVARQLSCSSAALAGVARWGRAGGGAAAAEAPRLLAWAARLLRGPPRLLQVDGCVASLVNMLVVCHAVMQNEAILALTLLAIESLNNKTSPAEEPNEFDYEKSFISQLINAEIGKHVAVLIDTNCAKMPKEVAENLLAFLDITSKKNNLASDYKDANVHESLRKFNEARTDFDDLKPCISVIVDTISSNGKTEE